MERACPSCGAELGEEELTSCPACGEGLAAAPAADDDVFEDLGDFGEVGTDDFIPLPGQDTESAGDGELDLDDLFGGDGDQAAPASEAAAADDEFEIDDLLGEADDDGLIALPGTGEGASLEEEDLDALFGDDNSEEETHVPLPGSNPPSEADTMVSSGEAATIVSAGEAETVIGVDEVNDPLADLLDDGPAASPDIVETEVADSDAGGMDLGFSLDEAEDPLLDVLGGELEEFLQEPEQAMYHLRMSTGDVVGPYMSDRVENMLRTGMLRGDEEISADGQSWQPLGAHADFAPFVDNDAFVTTFADEGPTYMSDAADQDRLPELVGVEVKVMDQNTGVEVIQSEFADAQPKGGRKKLLVGVAVLLVFVGVGAWQLGGLTVSGPAEDAGDESAPRSRAGVATTSSRFSRINDVLKEDRLAALMKRGTLLRNAVSKSQNQDLEARVAYARISCDLNIRFDLPLERMKMVNALKGMTEEMIRGNAFDIARACRSLADRNEGQLEVYLAKHIKAKDVEALQLAILVAASLNDKALLEQRREMSL